MFGRKKQQQEEAREAERRALFEELAKRPDTICPFLGLESARTEFRDRVSDGHRCYAFGDPAELSAEQQQKVCLQRGYGNCPRYLRGVLVIPTEELEALRHPKPAPPPPAPPPVPAVSSGGGGRRGLVVALVLLLLVAGGGGGAFLALNGGLNVVAQETPSPMPTPSPESVAPSVGPSLQPSLAPTDAPTATPQPTPVVTPSGTALPTPEPNDTFTGYVIHVEAGRYPTLLMDAEGTVYGEEPSIFDSSSWAPVQRIVYQAAVYWRTLLGGYTDHAYNRELSGFFEIYATYETPEGESRFRLLDESEY